MPEKPEPVTPAKVAAKALREARLAAALRANLRRRKAAASAPVGAGSGPRDRPEPPSRRKP